MCVCVCACVCVCVRAHMYMCVCVRACVSACACMSLVCMSAHAPLCRQFGHLLQRVEHDGDINTGRLVEHFNKGSHLLSSL